MKRALHIVVLILIVSNISIEAQKYFVSFTDKSNNTYSIDAPSEFLSSRAISRREKFNIPVTQQDLPVSSHYVDSLKRMGIKVLWPSKWFNGAIVESNNKSLIDTIARVSFIDEAKLIWKQPTSPSANKFVETEILRPYVLKSASKYGSAWNQTQTVNGHFLHQNGYEGQDMVIAVLDNGFDKVNELSSFSHLWDNKQILSFRNSVDPTASVFDSDSHGTMVLSVMGGTVENSFVGCAPKTSYHLLRTEDNASECPIEEYNWVLGAEYADSIGADLINSSLGYYSFDSGFENYVFDDMNGETTIVVQGAEIAFSKGIVVVNSAGNEGTNRWGKIISPADGKNVLAVAAMKSDSIRAMFSSYGPSADGRVKPDVTAIGQGTALQNIGGDISYYNGTSFSAPVISGFVACLWQAFPKRSNKEIVQLVKEKAHQFIAPDSSFGYGIPNFKEALGIDNSVKNNKVHPIKIFPNPVSSILNVSTRSGALIEQIRIYDIVGNLVYSKAQINISNSQIEISSLTNGVYMLQVELQNGTFTRKIIKR